MSNPEAGQAPSARRVLAVIPARGGSKGVPAKNLAPVGGVPLVARAVRECLAAHLVTDVVVSTDDHAIAAAARESGAEVVLRPAAIAGDTATSEAAVLHALDAHESRHGAPVDVVLLVQCTSPFILREDIDGVARAVVEHGADTALTVAPFHGFIWRDTADEFTGGDVNAESHDMNGEPYGVPGTAPLGTASPASASAHGEPAGTDGPAGPDAPRPATGLTGAPGALPGDVRTTPGITAGGYGVNHDKSFRPRRQDRPQDLLETGAAYAMDAAGLRKHQHRFFGRTEPVRTDPARVLEIDDRTTSPAPRPSRRSSTRTAPAPSPPTTTSTP